MSHWRSNSHYTSLCTQRLNVINTGVVSKVHAQNVVLDGSGVDLSPPNRTPTTLFDTIVDIAIRPTEFFMTFLPRADRDGALYVVEFARNSQIHLLLPFLVPGEKKMIGLVTDRKTHNDNVIDNIGVYVGGVNNQTHIWGAVDAGGNYNNEYRSNSRTLYNNQVGGLLILQGIGYNNLVTDWVLVECSPTWQLI